MLAVVTAGLCVIAACNQKPKTLRRIAILPANVLVGDAGSDWMKLAAPLVLQQDLLSARYVSPTLAPDEAVATKGGAQDFLRVKVESRQGKVHIETETVDVATKKTTATQQEDAASMAELIPALNRLAKKLESTSGDFSTKNTEALKAFATAVMQPTAEKRLELFQQALSIDPSFGMCYFLLIEMTASHGPQSYASILEKARSQRASFTPYDQARLNMIDRQVSNASIAEKGAAAEAVLKVAPNDTDALSVVAGIHFLNDDTKGGIDAINHAIELNPENPNLKAQLAEGLVQARRYKEAEAVLQKLAQNPAVLPELATVILLQGDVNRANQTVEKMLAAVPNPEYQTVLRGSWFGMSDQRAKGIDTLENGKFANGNIKALALSEVVTLRLMDKDTAGAQRAAKAAAAADNHPTAVAAVAELLANGGGDAAEWRKKVEASALTEQMREPILAYGFFLNGHYPEAVEEWRKLLAKTNGIDLRSRAMLASALDRAGKTDEARKISVQPFLVREFVDLYGAVAFTEMRRMVAKRSS